MLHYGGQLQISDLHGSGTSEVVSIPEVLLKVLYESNNAVVTAIIGLMHGCSIIYMLRFILLLYTNPRFPHQ